jgi:3-phenylpropionate/trans-cinnamate dioxygenase ferredoxin subunit
MLKDGEKRELAIGEAKVLLVRVEDHYYATQAACPHLRARLVRGKLQDDILTCAAHGSQFNVTTGEAVGWVEGLPGFFRGVAQAISKPQNLQTYPTKIQEGQIWIQI